MNRLPNINDLVVMNTLPDAIPYRVVELSGNFGVGLIDSTIEHIYPHPFQSVQWVDRCYIEKVIKKA